MNSSSIVASSADPQLFVTAQINHHCGQRKPGGLEVAAKYVQMDGELFYSQVAGELLFRL